MDNTEKLEIFRSNLTDDLLPLHQGPAVLGGPTQQRITTHFKVDGDYKYEDWVGKALCRLAQIISQSFASPIQFYRLDVPEEDNVIEDDKVCIRESSKEVPEKWDDGEKVYDAHTRVVFEAIFQFEVTQ